MRIKNPRDAVASIFLICFAAAIFWFGRDLSLGSTMFMGPAYIPYLLAGLLLFFGIVIWIGSLVHEGPSIPGWRARSFVLIISAVVVFAFSLERLGLAIAAPVSVFVASAASSEFRPIEAAVFAIAITAFTILLFSTLLGMPIRIWPW